jgi:hypothetical protein
MPAALPTPAWSLDTLRLPKTLENAPGGPALRAALRTSARKLWAGGAILVPTVAWSPELAAVLGEAQREGQLVRGLEQIERTLGREARGLSMADARSATERGSRVSRLMLVTQDGTERFYRQAERLVCAQGQRVLAIRVEADSALFGGVVPHLASSVVRALLVEHKDAVVRVLLALSPK